MTTRTLIVHSHEQEIAKKIAQEIQGEIEKNKSHFRIHTKTEFDINNLRTVNSVDLNFFEYSFDYNNINLMVSDMDSTLISIETIDEVAKEVGLYSEVSLITEEAMLGNLDFSESFKKRLSILKGVRTESFDAVFKNRMDFNPGARELITFFSSNQIKTALVSGGINYFAEKVKNNLGIDKFKANEVEIIDESITGNALGKVVDGKAKAGYIEELCEFYDINSEQVIAIGDGANDLEMMKVAGLSVAYKGKPILKKNCNIQINHSGLDSLIDFFE